MKHIPLLTLALCLTAFPAFSQQPQVPVAAGTAQSTDVKSAVLAVDSPAFVFSPGNWVGDEGREGKQYRQTWNPGAYLRITWESATAKVTPTLLLDNSSFDGKTKPPVLACNLDGIWTSELPCAKEVTIPGLKGTGKHVLTVYLKRSEQVNRWGTKGASGTNVVRIAGVKVDADSKPVASGGPKPWALIIGDSITEGIGASELEGYSHLVGQAFVSMGYEYGISACGWSGWLFRGDNPPGDVPGYYRITDSVNGAGGKYDEADSRWNKVDANHSFLDLRGHLSAYGHNDQEPAAILINYGTNDAIHPTNASDVKASMTQCLEALRGAAPAAHIFFIIPFGQYKAQEIRQTVSAYQSAHPDNHSVSIIDLGPEAAKAITVNGYWGGLHPNPRAHATFAAQITAQIMTTLAKSAPAKP